MSTINFVQKIKNLFYDKFVFGIVITNLIFYVPTIAIINGFILDDYYLFYLIAQNSQAPIAFNPDEAFFLFMRPISYLTFWIDYHIFFNDAFPMKVISLFLHLIVVISFYKLLKRILIVLLKTSEDYIAFLITLIFSFHLDSSIWIYWVSNRTELLIILFYQFSLISFLKYIESSKNYHLTLSTIFYVLSILSKQSGLHLPILFLFIIYFLKWKSEEVNKKSIKLFFITNIIILLMISLLNIFVYESDLNLVQNLWKKPFAALGNLLHVIIPCYSQNVYNYFLVHKLQAIIIFSIVAGCVIAFVSLNKRRYFKKVLPGFILFLIIMYPRIFAVADTRINSILVLWGLVILALIVVKIPNNAKIYLPIIYLVFTLIVLILRLYEVKDKIQSYDHTVEQFRTYVKNSSKDDLVIVAENNFTLNYHAYFLEHKKFGVISGVINSPVFYNTSLVYFNEENFKKPFINVSRNNRSISVESTNDLIFLSADRRRINYNFHIDQLIPQPKSREYKKITFSLSDKLNIDSLNMIYFDGIAWRNLK